jgi:hypothetical protein
MVDDLRTFGCRKVQIGNDVKNVEHKHVEMLDGATSKMYSEGTVQWYDVSLVFSAILRRICLQRWVSQEGKVR